MNTTLQPLVVRLSTGAIALSFAVGLRKFVEFYLEQAPEVVRSVGYVPLPEDGYHLIEVKFYNSKTGTVFDGQSEFDLTIGELLRKQPKF